MCLFEGIEGKYEIFLTWQDECVIFGSDFWNYVFIFEGIEGKYEIFLTSKMNASFSAVTVATIRSIQLGGTSDTVLSL